MRRAAATLATLGLAAAAACSGGSDGSDGGAEARGGGGGDGATATTTAPGEGFTYPGDDWGRADPEEMGFDQAVLDEIAGRAEEAGSNCLVVTRQGRLVAEWYWNGTDASSAQEVFSVTKSVTSTLVGIAQDDGDLDIGDPAAEYIPEWEGTPSEDVTVENLLSNDSGREWSFGLDYTELPRSPDRTGFAVGLGQDAPPGTSWAYNNAAIQTLEAVLEGATGDQVADHARERLFSPTGMDGSEMTADPSGNTATFFGLRSTCEDLARFGYLALRGGAWDGEQVVSGDWVEAATGGPSQEMNAAYGYLWWLNRRGPVLSAVQATTAEDSEDIEDGQMVPEAPEDMFWALGLGNQIVSVDPGSETVVVRLGGTAPPEGAEPFTQADAAAVVTDAYSEP